MNQTLFFGTYTKKISAGIYRSELDPQTARLSKPTVFIKIDNPTYLQTTASGNLYTVAKKGNAGGIASFACNQDAQPQQQSQLLSAGAPPCYVGWDAGRNLVYTANYHKATLSVFSSTAGKLTLIKELKFTGSGPLPGQEQAHIHYTDLTPDQRLAICDLGSDRVYIYNVSATHELEHVFTYHAESGFAPRHLVFHPNHKYAYLVGELSSQVAMLEYHAETGELVHKQTLSTLPLDWHGENGAAAIRLTRDGKFLYVSNRGHDSLATFAIAADGRMQATAFTATEGEFPRDFALDSTDRFLVVANQKTNNATLFERSLATGALTCKQKNIPVPEGVCVSFSHFQL
ncbi:lactonase family protein [Liquorilactobacillus satsumensis]|uniref:lactonase family protein n=1 Tax=Liquorilactobacillus satsumensis TaxID=259059 RepID=UPI001E60A7E2|nr:lactonase family protein [Liquorilactobacillus satsumensis]MCC7665715.1 6-phosphogluconolactonase [Liquorilactobacillus satsumensis]MCP9356491.1 lactonase family protein [Liquorilactobacillus satsumensis]MCP9370370.1 lactonase family protein [Liquorilactobacillus satsumensis]